VSPGRVSATDARPERGAMKDSNLQICHAAASATRVNQAVEPWVSQQALVREAWLKARPSISELPM